MILCADPLAQYRAQKEHIDQAIARVLAGGRYILGTETSGLEAEFASFVGTSHAVGVANGTDALHIALVALGVGAGDEVITVSHTAVATVAAIKITGATPVFVDIDAASFTMDPRCLEEAITSRTKVIVAVHLYGQPADIDGIMRIASPRGIFVVEDCAQAAGARSRGRVVGSIGHVGCFSFYPTKNLGALGDGGMMVTNSSETADQARLLRQYGWKERYVSHLAGWNSRLDEIQSAVLRVKLPQLDADNAMRRTLADRYDEGLVRGGVETPARLPDSEHVFHLYVIRSRQREDLQRHLRAKQVDAMVHYPVPVHKQPAYSESARTPAGGLPETELAADQVLSLPMHPQLGRPEQEQVISAVVDFHRDAPAARAS